MVADHARRHVRLDYAIGLKSMLSICAVLFLGAQFLAGQAAPAASTPEPQGGPFAGSVASEPVAGTMRISLQDAIDRGLRQNLGVLLSSADIQFARGQRWEQLSELLPHVVAAPYVDVSKANLSEV